MHFKPGLYIVSTPIGNLEDITLRALSALKMSDIIICEDTRISGKLLAKHGIKKSLMVYNDGASDKIRESIAALIDQGKILSLISDAGTPLISDPGYKLVRDLKSRNYHIDVIPGVCSPIAALTLSGLPTDRFIFGGFLPKTAPGKKKFFEEFVSLKATLIFFDTAIRLVSSLKVALEVFGDRQSNIAREITKLYQESRSLKISEQIAHYEINPPKGEVVLIIAGNIIQELGEEEITTEIAKLLKFGVSAKSATDLLLEKYKGNYSRKDLYNLVNKLKLDKKP